MLSAALIGQADPGRIDIFCDATLIYVLGPLDVAATISVLRDFLMIEMSYFISTIPILREILLMDSHRLRGPIRLAGYFGRFRCAQFLGFGANKFLAGAIYPISPPEGPPPLGI